MKTYLGIDVGGTFIKSALISETGTVSQEKKVATPDNMADFLILLENLVAESKDQITGVGISAPGRIDVKTGYVHVGGALLYLKDLALKDHLEQKFGLPCAVINDAKAAVLAEHWLGNLKEVQNGAALVLGTGVGSGIILNGQLLQGSHFQAGELTFMLRSAGTLDMRNLTGMAASAVGFISRAASLLDLSDKNDGQTVFEAIKAGDNAELTQLFEAYCREIVFMIYNLQAVIDVEKVVIGGGISSQDILIDQVRDIYLKDKRSSDIYDAMFTDLKIEPCAFRNASNMIGAVSLLVNNKR
ncbi:ROK family protein [Streptococcus merionis]|uniref:ROK protein n=1 Tax=Streptococcus merionis TaxID=400065 RepID=A0A239ST43_9STRE|nr:ROK family protein [Streptococcus merionis]SNU88577.1 ROK protein [Streptococcus merionis]